MTQQARIITGDRLSRACAAMVVLIMIGGTRSAATRWPAQTGGGFSRSRKGPSSFRVTLSTRRSSTSATERGCSRRERPNWTRLREFGIGPLTWVVYYDAKTKAFYVSLGSPARLRVHDRFLLRDRGCDLLRACLSARICST